ncbi:MAG: O-antigen ligase family protein [Candidatus Magasanikbacteria bacterium]|nr:O-antigen ligase family protein [Candidatus Magasanikbacteria bacterium]
MSSHNKKFSLSILLQYSLSLLLFLLPWQTIWITKEHFLNGSKWEYGTLGLYANEILLFFCAGIFCIDLWKKIKERKTNGSFNFSWTTDRRFILSGTIFIAYTFCSIIWSSNRLLAWQHAIWFMESFLLFFMLIAQSKPYSLRLITYSFIAGSVIQSILGIWQFLSQSTFASNLLGLSLHRATDAGASIISTILDGRWLRAYGSFAHPNILGGYLVIAIIITDIIFHRNAQTKSYRLSTIGYQFISLLQLTALFFTFSRSAWIAAAIWMVGSSIKYHVACTTKYLLSFIIYRLSLIIILTTIFSPLVFTRFSSSTTNEARSLNERTVGYNESLQIIKQYPFLGVGSGNYTAELNKQNPNLPGYIYQPVHNVPLLFLAELGIVGLILLSLTIWFLISYIRSSLLSQKTTLTAQSVPYIGLISLLPLITFDHYLFSSYSGLLLTGIFLSFLTKISSPSSPQNIHTTS